MYDFARQAFTGQPVHLRQPSEVFVESRNRTESVIQVQSFKSTNKFKRWLLSFYQKFSNFIKNLQAKHYLPSRLTPAMALGSLASIFLIVGSVAAFVLVSKPQEIRQQAAGGAGCWCTGFEQCNPGWDWSGGEGYCSEGLKCCSEPGTSTPAETPVADAGGQGGGQNSGGGDCQKNGDCAAPKSNGSCPSGFAKNQCGNCLWDKCVTVNKYCDELIQNYCGVAPCWQTGTCEVCEYGTSQPRCGGKYWQECTKDNVWYTSDKLCSEDLGDQGNSGETGQEKKCKQVGDCIDGKTCIYLGGGLEAAGASCAISDAGTGGAVIKCGDNKWNGREWCGSCE